MTNQQFEKMISDAVSRMPEPKMGMQGILDKIEYSDTANLKKKRKYHFSPVAAILTIFLLGATVFAASPTHIGMWISVASVSAVEAKYDIDLPETLGSASLKDARYNNLCKPDTPWLLAILRPVYRIASVTYDATSTETVIVESNENYHEAYGWDTGYWYDLTVGKMDESHYWSAYFNIDEESLEYLGLDSSETSDSDYISQIYPAAEYNGYTLYIKHSAFTDPETGGQNTSVTWVDIDKNLIFCLCNYYDSYEEINIDRAVEAAKEFIDLNLN